MYFKELSPQQIYHVAVMPCFDKKLEASRSDFYLTNAETREVDCVITSGTVITPIVAFVRMDSQYPRSYFSYLLKGRF